MGKICKTRIISLLLEDRVALKRAFCAVIAITYCRRGLTCLLDDCSEGPGHKLIRGGGRLPQVAISWCFLFLDGWCCGLALLLVSLVWCGDVISSLMRRMSDCIRACQGYLYPQSGSCGCLLLDNRVLWWERLDSMVMKTRTSQGNVTDVLCILGFFCVLMWL